MLDVARPSGRTLAHDRALEVVTVLVYMIGMPLVFVAGFLVGGDVWPRVTAIAVILFPIVGLRDLARADPIGWVTTMGPVMLLGAVAVVTGWAWPFLLAAAWIGAWMLYSGTFWPLWSRQVLRRPQQRVWATAPRSRATDSTSQKSPSLLVGGVLRWIASASNSRPRMATLLVVAMAASLLGTSIQQGLVSVWTDEIYSIGGLGGYHDFYILTGTLFVSLIAYLLIRPWSGRPGFFDLGLLLIDIAIAQRLTVPVMTTIGGVIAPLNPGAWSYLFGAASNGSGAVHPGIIIGVFVAIAFVVLSLVLGSAWPRARKADGAALDAAHLERFVERGTDLAKPRQVDYSFLLPTDAAASQLAAALRAREPEATVLEKGVWVEATVRMALSAELMAERRATYEALATEHGGKYHGWGAYADTTAEPG